LRESTYHFSSTHVALVSKPAGIAFERQDLGVMDEPIDHRRGGDLVAEDLASLSEGDGSIDAAGAALHAQ